jgi:ABC-2 type transport system permease protein
MGYALLALVLIIVFAAALGLALAALNVFFRDVQYLVEVIMLVLLWASPVVYAWSMPHKVLGDGWLMNIYTANPVTLAVLGFQRAFWSSGSAASYPADLGLRMTCALAVSLIFLAYVHSRFVRVQGRFAQEL